MRASSITYVNGRYKKIKVPESTLPILSLHQSIHLFTLAIPLLSLSLRHFLNSHIYTNILL